MAVAVYLVDTSALGRLDRSEIANVLDPLLQRGLGATCAMLNLEALWSARSPDDYTKIQNWRNAILEYIDTDEADMGRAQEVQGLLAASSQHRAVKLPDLIISAVAERHGLTVLHYDSDFDIVASVTGQTMQWIVPRGSSS